MCLVAFRTVEAVPSRHTRQPSRISCLAQTTGLATLACRQSVRSANRILSGRPRLRRPKAEIGNMSHTGVFTHGSDPGDRCGFIGICLGHDHHGSIRGFEPEPKSRLRVNKQFKRACHGSSLHCSLSHASTILRRLASAELINPTNTGPRRNLHRLPRLSLTCHITLQPCQRCLAYGSTTYSTGCERIGLSHTSPWPTCPGGGTHRSC